MEKFRLDAMEKGWFVGPFSPSVLVTDQAEVAVKRYEAGATEALHHHREAKEITVIVSGEVVMNGVKYVEGDILVIHEKESTDFKALIDTVTVVVKMPAVLGDKYSGAYDGE